MITQTSLIALGSSSKPKAGLSRQGQTTFLPADLPTLSVASRSLSSRTAPKPMIRKILAAHNRYRAELNLPMLKWSNRLARDAQKWANRLAALGGKTLQHDPNSKQGENLWLGSSGAFSYQQMVDAWGAEKQNFVRGTFPNVSKTGNWSDVGHYTQIIWRKTKQVGCAIVTAGGNDILVCRYNPPGNVMWQAVY
jgi:uncharacterized protein YkwD